MGFFRALFSTAPDEAESSSSIISMGAAATGAGGGDGASARLVSDCGTTAMTSLPSTKMGRLGITGVSSWVCKARGASATTVSRVFFQSSPDKFCTMPHTCRCTLSFSSTRRYDGRHTGASAM